VAQAIYHAKTILKETPALLTNCIYEFLKGTIDQTNLASLLLISLDCMEIKNIVENEIEKLQVLQILNRSKSDNSIFEDFRSLTKSKIVIAALTNPAVSKVSSLFASAAVLVSEGNARCMMNISLPGKKYQITLSCGTTSYTIDPYFVFPIGEIQFKLQNAISTETKDQSLPKDLVVTPEKISQFRFTMANITGKKIEEFYLVECVACHKPISQLDIIVKHNLCSYCWQKHCWKCRIGILSEDDDTVILKGASSVSLCETCYNNWTCSSCAVPLADTERLWLTGLCNGCYNKWECSRCHNLLTKGEASYCTSLCNVCWDFYNNAQIESKMREEKNNK